MHGLTNLSTIVTAQTRRRRSLVPAKLFTNHTPDSSVLKSDLGDLAKLAETVKGTARYTEEGTSRWLAE